MQDHFLAHRTPSHFHASDQGGQTTSKYLDVKAQNALCHSSGFKNTQSPSAQIHAPEKEILEVLSRYEKLYRLEQYQMAF